MSEQPTSDLPWWRTAPNLGRHLWRERRNRFPLDQLARYVSQTIAWYPDGSVIRDTGEDMGVLWERFKALGEDPSWYKYEAIYPEEWYGSN